MVGFASPPVFSEPKLAERTHRGFETTTAEDAREHESVSYNGWNSAVKASAAKLDSSSVITDVGLVVPKKRASKELRPGLPPGAHAPPRPSRAQKKRAPSPNRAEDRGDGADVAPEVGSNLRRLRDARDLSLEKLAQLTGVSRAMLGQIELGQSTPTIKTVWKISRALDVPFSALLSGNLVGDTVLIRAAQTRRMTNEKKTFVSRALFPLGGPRRVEFYELRLAGNAEERAIAHPAGTVENLTVHQGKVEIEVRGERYSLSAGDVFVFQADAPHVYRNLAQRDAIFYLVMTYP